MSTLAPPRAWIAGARPRTLPAAVVPVVVGVAAAHAPQQPVSWPLAVCALIVSLAVQVATNYANDYSDGIRGTDTDRVGPLRLTASKTATPAAVRAAALLSFAVAGVAGLVIAGARSWWVIPLGAVCMAAGWAYTGTSRPYGYRGLGEVSVFVFFGLVATAGSGYAATGHVTALALTAGVPVGLLAVALLVVNNLRDIPTDRDAGKMTLAVRLGDAGTRKLYVASLAGALAISVALALARPWTLLTVLAAPLVITPIRAVRAGTRGRDLIAVLGATGRAQLALGALLAAGLWL